MKLETTSVDGETIRRAIESRDGRLLASLYAPDAVVRVIDRSNPPSRPRVVKGRPAIAQFWDDICSRAMTHEVATTIAEGDDLAFTQSCAYPDGTRVFCVAVLKLQAGRIGSQTIVQAWDE
jgi:ketosteroid isomerase-like protein